MYHLSLGFYKKYRKLLVQYLATRSREQWLFFFFFALFFLVFWRLFQLQVLQGDYYQQTLIDQHFTKSSLKAERGNIFVKDRSDKSMQLTENINVYNLFVDPNFLPDKKLFIQEFTPLIYDHFCVQYEMQTPTPLECVQYIEKFSKKKILPDKQVFFYGGELLLSGDNFSGASTQYEVDQQYQEEVQSVLSGFTKEGALDIIADTLDTMIYTGIRARNYLGYFENPAFLTALQVSGHDYLSLEDNAYVYIDARKVEHARQEKEWLANLNQQYNAGLTSYQIQRAFQTQKLNYVKIISNMNGLLAGRVKELKKKYDSKEIRKKYNMGMFHGVGLEESKKRYYPYGQFMATVLGYFDNSLGKGQYGVEEYFETRLAGKDGKIVGLATPFIGQVGSNAVDMEEAKNGDNVYLTLDPVIQKEVERMTLQATKDFRADGIAVTIMDPYSGKIKAMVNTPLYDPNRYDQAYKLKPLTIATREYIDNDSYVEHPVLFLSGGDLQFAKEKERKNPELQKYIFANGFGSLVFLNRNISLPYEPGSIFKPITLGIGIDSNSIDLYDYYNDPGEVMVGDFRIANVMQACIGNHTFSHALAFSCNVGMVRIAQQMTKYIFYSYLEKLGFTKKTGIELAREDTSFVPNMQDDSVAGFFNNTFGHGLLSTPLQMSVVFSALVNGGTLIQPSIIESLEDGDTTEQIPFAKKQKNKVFATATSENVKDALVEVVRYGSIDKIKKPGFSIGAKSGTSEIARKNPRTGKVDYRGDVGWTNGSALALVTRENTKYLIVIQVRRPRSSKWGNDTAVKLADQILGFLLEYSSIDK